MNHTHDSLEQVADFCERHLESTRGPEIGMTFGSAIQTLGRLADHTGNQDDPEWRLLNDRADELLLEFSKRFIVAFGWVGPAGPRAVAVVFTDMGQ